MVFPVLSADLEISLSALRVTLFHLSIVDSASFKFHSGGERTPSADYNSFCSEEVPLTNWKMTSYKLVCVCVRVCTVCQWPPNGGPTSCVFSLLGLEAPQSRALQQRSRLTGEGQTYQQF